MESLNVRLFINQPCRGNKYFIYVVHLLVTFKFWIFV